MFTRVLLEKYVRGKLDPKYLPTAFHDHDSNLKRDLRWAAMLADLGRSLAGKQILVVGDATLLNAAVLLENGARQVVSVDIAPEPFIASVMGELREKLPDKPFNVIYAAGDSRRTLPRLLTNADKTLRSQAAAVIDGGADYLTLRTDLENVLRMVPPNAPIYVRIPKDPISAHLFLSYVTWLGTLRLPAEEQTFLQIKGITEIEGDDRILRLERGTADMPWPSMILMTP